MKANICFFVMAQWGYGDVIFTLKLYKLFKKWYNISPYIVSTVPDKFVINGILKSKIIQINNKEMIYSDNRTELNLSRLSGKKFTKQFDLIFVTPVVVDGYEKDFSHFQYLFPYITKDMLYRFSAYDHTGTKYEIPMGLSKGRYGIFVSDCTQQGRLKTLKNPYIVTHISKIVYTTGIYDYINCFTKFIKLMIKKYHGVYPVLDIIIPLFITKEPKFKKIKKYIKKYYKSVKVIYKSDTLLTNGVNFRCDLPFLPHKEYVKLFNHCLPDVLITGNQSVSDIISCHNNYNIYYQTLPWEVKFAKNLGILLDKPYLKKRSSACGGEYGNRKMLLLKTDSTIIKKKYNFEILGRRVINKIMKPLFQKK